MLRDKFIHYFQQWRERQLSRGEHWLAQHLAGRSPREKGMLLAAVVFLFSVGYYVLIWQPLSERIEQQETMLQQLVAMNTRLRSAAPILWRRENPPQQRLRRYRGLSVTALPRTR
ncbi:membrane-anchored secretion pathway M-type protein [Escherichia coli]|nr:membrane-anchored secretion pathway M-type protein [Escherichia coli]